MVDEMAKRNGTLDQEHAWHNIRQTFGEEFAGLNRDGGCAISKSVLREFRKLTGADVVWERGSLEWRRKTKFDPPGRLVDYTSRG
jgi:hypothetical protein